MHKTIKGLLIILVACVSGLAMLSHSEQALAVENQSFTVKAIIPDNQVDEAKTYFDLQLPKGQKQTLEVKLHNNTDKKIIIESELHRAATNINGVVEYYPSEEKADQSLEVDIETIAVLEKKEITIEPQGDAIAKIILQAPIDEFTGIVAGGLRFLEKATDRSEKNNQSTTVKNKYAYVIGLVLHGTKPLEEQSPELLLNQVGLIRDSSRSLIFANLQNPQPVFLKNLTVAAKVTAKGKSEALLTHKRLDVEVAPNTNFNYGIPLDGTVLKAGMYTLTLTVTGDSNKWEFAEEFEIKEVEAEQIEIEAAPAVPTRRSWLPYLAAGLLILFLGVGGASYYWFVQKKAIKRKRNKKKKKTKKN